MALGLVLLAFASASPIAAGTATAGPRSADLGTALRIAAESVVHRRAMALGRDLVVDGTLRADAIVLSGDARIEGAIEGDLVVLGGDVLLGPSARVDGDVSVFGGTVSTEGAAAIGGRLAASPTASNVWVALLEAPLLGRVDPRVAIGVKLALLAFWTLLSLLLMSVARRPLLATSSALRQAPFRCVWLGLVGVAALVLTVLLCSALVGVVIGVPLLALTAVVALGLRFWGMVAVFHAIGSWGLERLRDHGPPALARWAPRALEVATIGLLALGVLKLVPHLGEWTWTLATFAGVGATLEHTLARRLSERS